MELVDYILHHPEHVFFVICLVLTWFGGKIVVSSAKTFMETTSNSIDKLTENVTQLSTIVKVLDIQHQHSQQQIARQEKEIEELKNVYLVKYNKRA